MPAEEARLAKEKEEAEKKVAEAAAKALEEKKDVADVVATEEKNETATDDVAVPTEEANGEAEETEEAAETETDVVDEPVVPEAAVVQG